MAANSQRDIKYGNRIHSAVLTLWFLTLLVMQLREREREESESEEEEERMS